MSFLRCVGPLVSIGCDAQRVMSIGSRDKLRTIQLCATLPTLRAMLIRESQSSSYKLPER
jgi:hypothetical protein